MRKYRDPREFGRVRDLREDADLNQKQVADYLSVAQTTYSDYELGKLNIPIPILVKLANFYKTSIDYIVGLTSERESYPRDCPAALHRRSGAALQLSGCGCSCITASRNMVFFV